MNLKIIINKKKQLGLTSEALSKKSGVPLGTINKILRGVTKSPQIDTLSAICKVLGCNVNDVIFDDTDKISAQSMKMLSDHFNFDDYSTGSRANSESAETRNSKMRTLKFIKANDNVKTAHELEILVNNAPVECDFAVQMCDNSMSPLYNDGDIVFAKKSDFITSGNIGVFRVNGTIYVRKFESNTLTALNPAYPPMYISEIKFEKIEGIAVILDE